ncbi:MAG TPA: tRNA (adenosine(37)-N6)-threonylcarbamoyltransferase complex ATPase subunit type 1 TsaE [Sphingomonadales bacterium]|nr:tRNA (adenosine(37)-N6)-threonylcarbamoyltransferase complex ATPase subunit type 1 TsaE [Sphingomonadales bacterium]
MNLRVFHDLSEEEVGRLAHVLAPLCRRGDVLALSGELGAGKTVFARAFIRTLAGDDALEVPSPTFTLAQRYAAKESLPPVWHVDLYRLKDESELRELGLEDAMAEGVVLIEWPEKAAAFLPEATLNLAFRPGGSENTRTLTLGGGAPWVERLRKLNLVRR